MALKTYLLAPNFTLEPQGPIRIGNIIADPYYPTKPLSTPLNPPVTATHTDFECSFSRDSKKSLQGSVWAEFFRFATPKTSGKVGRATLLEYTMDSLETIRIKEDPSDEEASELVKDPKVQAAIKAGISGTTLVYMITGLKVARGFRLDKSVTSTRGGGIKTDIAIISEVGVGTDISISHSKGTSESLRSGNDIIFAYQLHMIASKRWWHKRVEIDVYTPKTAFLNHEEPVGKEDEMTAKLTTHLHLLEVADENEYDSVKVVEALDGDEACFCVEFDET
ncbi:hypothetical protein G7Z17_g5514 [Cylindrodendrum hubeiense]|uniref:Uncharacterized protein n=1 Tax=Cylindrodendrum hubeiense TaxID=595255 RepID=A0A9P5L907_9HYPO|nr:hypothetical protein G7Z17_g5514 [Cylindrodendrum hubeiense]